MSLDARRISVGYDRRVVVDGLDLTIGVGEITALIGPNACGKSTLLGALGRVLPVRGGAVLLAGQDIHRLPTREVARRLGVLPQQPAAPEGITVAELVHRGRHPHQGLLARRTAHDDQAVATAMLRTGVADLATRAVDELSGGQRQRVWIAMALAQETSVLLLDEPTSYLDVAHQLEVLDLLVDLNREQGTTVVMVLHDLNHAARYASTVVAVKDGRIAACGPPREVVTVELVAEVFGVPARVLTDPDTGAPLVLARGRHDRPPTPADNDQHHKPDQPGIHPARTPAPLLAGGPARADQKDDA